MKKVARFVFSLLLVWLPYAQSQSSDGNVIRLEYNGHETPDHLVYEAIVQGIVAEDKEKTREEMIERVQSELNVKFDDSVQAWVFEKDPDRRFSAEEAKHVYQRMIVDARLIDRLNRESEKQILCRTTGIADRYGAFEMRDKKFRDIARESYEDVGAHFDEKTLSSIRRWISRVKPGFRGQRYDYEVLWQGREAELEQIHQSLCANVQVSQ